MIGIDPASMRFVGVDYYEKREMNCMTWIYAIVEDHREVATLK